MSLILGRAAFGASPVAAADAEAGCNARQATEYKGEATAEEKVLIVVAQLRS